MDPDSIKPVISEQTKDILVWSGGFGTLYLLLQTVPFTLRLAVGAIGSAIGGGLLGTKLAIWLLHLAPDYIGAMAGLCGFLGHMAFLGLLRLGEAWRDDPQGVLARWLPFLRKGS